MAGLIVALIALPAVGSAGLTARDAANNFEDMEGELKTTPPSEKTVMYDASGKQVATFFDKYRESVRLDQVDPIMRKAIIDIEDSRFYEHGALDLKGTIRALASNVESEQTQGGSTLTQQYVKNLLVDSARTQEEYREATAPTVGRKLRELRYALDIEQRMTKDQILEGYLNIAYFGAGAYGVQAAAKRYFSVPASKLNLGQAALLAGITQNPAAFDPIRNPKDARHRRDIVLYRMAQLGHISKAQADEEAAKPIELNRTDPVGGCQSSKAPYFCEYVKYDMLNILSDGKYWELEPKQQQAVVNELNRGGYTIRTTLDMEDQRAVDKTLRSTVAPGGNRVGAEAMVEPGTGKVKAIGLSKRFGPGKGRTTINLPADSHHGGGNGVSAGSTFKIFTLAAAIDQGIPVSTTINSPQTTTIGGFQPCRYTGMYQGKKVKNAMIGGGTWTLSNAGDSEKGNFNLKTGTWHSVNTFYAHLEKRVGVCNAVKMAEKFGMKQGNGNPLLPIASQVLGVNDIDMVHLAAAYAGLRRPRQVLRPHLRHRGRRPRGQEAEAAQAGLPPGPGRGRRRQGQLDPPGRPHQGHRGRTRHRPSRRPARPEPVKSSPAPCSPDSPRTSPPPPPTGTSAAPGSTRCTASTARTSPAASGSSPCSAPSPVSPRPASAPRPATSATPPASPR
ncbi:transglycosylase domain-containing protein [Actinomadura madurae]|uniref:transglycosylase domain-containing protein n=1 Tax=Actinomadura madurae TaxID=1993 RepID=UPI0020D20494|nr:transglycosylase domain-containing protein [Actinomadura madurae]MCP9969103.1 transglycosylase domain-containing protein [Actinomadura madurae]